MSVINNVWKWNSPIAIRFKFFTFFPLLIGNHMHDPLISNLTTPQALDYSYSSHKCVYTKQTIYVLEKKICWTCSNTKLERGSELIVLWSLFNLIHIPGTTFLSDWPAMWSSCVLVVVVLASLLVLLHSVALVSADKDSTTSQWQTLKGKTFMFI